MEKGMTVEILGIKPMVLGESFRISNLQFWELCARAGRGGLGEAVAAASIVCKYFFKSSH
jgi:hypothetical protein